MKTFKAFGTGPWLRYAPYLKFELPHLIELDQEAVFHNGNEVPAYEIAWPGQLPARLHRYGGAYQDVMPGEVIAHWKGVDHHHDVEIVRWLAEGPFPGTPDLWPEQLQYHIAVNYDLYSEQVEWLPEIPIRGIPHEVVQRVFHTQHAIDPEYRASILHLRHLATGFESDPLLNGSFDTVVRDQLYDLTVSAVRMFFFMIGDCIWSAEDKRWARGPFKHLWFHLATYLWWVGRTGEGLYAGFSGIPSPHADATPSDWSTVLNDGAHVGDADAALARELWREVDHRLWLSSGDIITPIVPDLHTLKALCANNRSRSTFEAMLAYPSAADGRLHEVPGLPLRVRFLLPKATLDDALDDRGADGEPIIVVRRPRGS